MSNQFELDERTLKEMLAELFEQGEKIGGFMNTQKVQQQEKDKTITELSKQTLTLINSFETKYKNIQITAPKPDLLPLYKILSESLTTIKTGVLNHLNDILSKKRILVLPEDGGKSFLKIISKRFIILTGFALIVCFGFRYWYLNSENSHFRKSWYWSYIKRDEKGKLEMINDLDSFKVSAINSYRTDSIERYQKEQATELRIKQLEREADSLKALKNQSN
jgi:hypothetical protein